MSFKNRFTDEKPKIYNLKDKLNFGKYSGLTIKSVLSSDPSYLIWANYNIKWFSLKPEIYESAKDSVVEEKFSRAVYRHIDRTPWWSDYDSWNDEDW